MKRSTKLFMCFSFSLFLSLAMKYPYSNVFAEENTSSVESVASVDSEESASNVATQPTNSSVYIENSSASTSTDYSLSNVSDSSYDNSLLSTAESTTDVQPRTRRRRSASYEATFVVNGSEKAVTFASPDETIGGSDNRGVAGESGGSTNKKYFIGWSTVASNNFNNESPLWYSSEKVGEAFPDGVDLSTKLYPVYFDRGFGVSITGKAYIDKDYTGRRIVANADDDQIKEDSLNNNKREIVIYYEDGKNYEINLDSSFEINKKLASWLYSRNGHTIMTNTQSGVESTAKASSSGDAKYTFTDLNVSLNASNDNFEIPTEYKLTFNGYYYQPYMVIDTDTREALVIKETNKSGKGSFDGLVTENPEVTFTVLNPNKVKNITIRTILRSNSGLGGVYIPGISAETIGNTDMELKSNSSIMIKNEKARAMSDITDFAEANGIINGYVKMPYTSFFGVSISLDTVISDIVANYPVVIKFVYPKVNFDSRKSTITGKQSDDFIAEKKGSYNSGLNEDSIADNMPANPENFERTETVKGKTVKVTYKFKGWNTSQDGSGAYFTGATKLRGDVKVYGIWEREEPEITPDTYIPENNGNNGGNSGNDDKPVKPEEKPITPDEKPVKPEEKPATPDEKTSEKDQNKSKENADKNKSGKDAGRNNKKSNVESSSLPRTGDAENNTAYAMAFLSLIALGVTGAFGTIRRKLSDIVSKFM